MKIRVALVIGLVLLFASAAMAATLPNLNNLGVISDSQSNFDPASVAIAPNGNTYVSDNFNSALKMYDYKGNFIKRVSVSYPFGMALDASGNLYVGSTSSYAGVFTGEVRVYDSNLNYKYSIGKGIGEFQHPISLAVDERDPKDKRLYVADAKANQIKIYDLATRNLSASFGTMGYGAGMITTPTGIAVNPVNGDLYIVDRALYTISAFDAVRSTAETNKAGVGASGQIFTRDGGFKSRFFYTSPLDTSAAAVTSPGGVAVDSLGRVYVTDSTGGEIHIFDADGNTLGVFDITAISGNASSRGLAFGADGRLLVAMGGKVQVLGLDNYTMLDVTPNIVDFNAINCTAGTIEKYLTISNLGAGNMLWTITPDADASWVLPAVTTGSINGQGSVNVGITLDTKGLADGVHSGKLTVSAPGAVSSALVRVAIYAPPVLSVDPPSATIQVIGTTITQSSTLNINLVGDPASQSSWAASSKDAWVSLSPSSGPTNAVAMAQVGANTDLLAAMAAGSYSATLDIVAACSGTAPVSVPVTLTYKKGGSLSVTSNIAEAGYTVSSTGGTFTGSGTNTVFNLIEGTYTVTFNKLAGFKEPATVTKVITNGEAVSVVGNYRDLRENNNIITSMGAGRCTGSEDVKVFNVAGALQATYSLPNNCIVTKGVANVKQGVVTAAGDVDGDGSEDLIVANMGKNYDEINAYSAAGADIFASNFVAYSTNKSVSTASADFDGNGVAEIVVGQGVTTASAAYVRVFGNSNGTLVDTGVYFQAASTKNGVNVATGDVDGDGKPEIITAIAVGTVTGAQVTIWKINVDARGLWTVYKSATISVGSTVAGVQLATGDVNSDGIDEIVVATTTSTTSGKALIQEFTSKGVKLASFQVSAGGAAANVSIAAGDLNADGYAEIAVGQIAAKSAANVDLFRANGTLLGSFTAYSDKSINGTRVSIGKVAVQ